MSDGPVIVGFRPESLSAAAEAPGLPRIDMEVDLVEELGNETLVFGNVPGEIASINIDPALPPPLPGARARVAARLQGFTDVARGETLPLAVDTRELYLFDAATGEALASVAVAAG